MGLFDILTKPLGQKTPGDEYYAAKAPQATALKKAGDHSAAAQCLEDAIEYWEENPPRVEYAGVQDIYPELDCYLRLAMYYQKAGRHDDGWQLLNRLHIGRYPARQATDQYYSFLREHRKRPADINNSGIPPISDKELREALASCWGFRFGEQARICDKKRLFLQREGKHGHAAVVGMTAYGLSLLCRAVEAPFEPVYQEGLDEMLLEENILAAAESLTKKVKGADLARRFTDVLLTWAEGLSDASESDLRDALGVALRESRF